MKPNGDYEHDTMLLRKGCATLFILGIILFIILVYGILLIFI